MKNLKIWGVATATLFLFLSLVNVNAQQITGNEITLVGSAPSGVTQANARIVGNSGPGVAYYWFVAVYTIGQARIYGPLQVNGMPNSLSVSNYVQLNWNLVSGASSYSVLKTSTPLLPTGTSNIAVVTGNTSGTVNDTGGALTAFTPNAVAGASGNIFINNSSYAEARFQFSIPIQVTKVCFSDGTCQTTAGGTGGIAKYTLATLPVTCTTGDAGYVTDAVTTGGGWRLYFCSATDTWSQAGVIDNGSNSLVFTTSNNTTFLASVNSSVVQYKNEKGVANGYASLDSSGLVPTSQLPATGQTLATKSVYMPWGPAADSALDSGVFSALTVYYWAFNNPYGSMSITHLSRTGFTDQASRVFVLGIYDGNCNLLSQTSGSDDFPASGTYTSVALNSTATITTPKGYIAFATDSTTGTIGLMIGLEGRNIIQNIPNPEEFAFTGSNLATQPGGVNTTITLPASCGTKTFVGANNKRSPLITYLWRN